MRCCVACRNADTKGILGINIGKNFDTPIEKAADDYLIGLEKAYPAAAYITVNISSPNTKNLRQLQGEFRARRPARGAQGAPDRHWPRASR
jgi:dihydroorotate dehydrogenase